MKVLQRLFQLSLFSQLLRLPRQSRQPRLVPLRSDGELKTIWDKLIDVYFPERQDLKRFQVQWSRRRQKRTLGSCNMTRSRVNLARELGHSETWQWVEPVLYHELCHAVLGKDVRRRNGRKAWHGQEFKAIEARHPGIAPLNRWMKAGGWHRAVRVDRARSSATGRKRAVS